jgi:predicted nucleic acid-binding protein
VTKHKARKATTPTATRRTRPTATRVATAPAASSTTLHYIESSALLAALIEQDAAALDAIRADGELVTSALTLTEATRSIVRARVAGRLRPDQERAAIRALRTFERRCSVVGVTEEVLTRAGRPFPVEPIRTLDAIHLATVELLGEPPQLVTIVTRDVRIRDNAAALGYAIG